jgi:hypothetical protein
VSKIFGSLPLAREEVDLKIWTPAAGGEERGIAYKDWHVILFLLRDVCVSSLL